MSCPVTKPIPQMYVENAISIPRRDWYKDHQHKHFKIIIGKTDHKSFFYDATKFLAFYNHIKGTFTGASGIRIYFARYLEEDSTDVPPRLSKMLTLIYVPLMGDPFREIADTFYILNPDEDFKRIPSQQAHDWINEYKITRIPVNGSHEYETVCVSHSISNFDEFISEMDCQDAKGVRAYIASFRDKEIVQLKPKYENRLFIEFALTKGRPLKLDIDIEKTENYDERKKRNRKDGFDNGTLCPPCTDCCAGQVTLMPPECVGTCQ